VSSLI